MKQVNKIAIKNFIIPTIKPNFIKLKKWISNNNKIKAKAKNLVQKR